MPVALLLVSQGICTGRDQFCLRTEMQAQAAGMRDEPSVF